MKNVNTKLELPQFSIFNINVRLNKVRENRSGNQENLTTFDTQDTRRSKKKNPTQYVLDTTIRKQTQIT
jgi:hypothetical protein